MLHKCTITAAICSPLPPLPVAPCAVRQSRFDTDSLSKRQQLNNITPGWSGWRSWCCAVGRVALLCSPLLPSGSDACPSPPPLEEEEGPEELFAHGQEAFERALHLWSQSLQAATRDGSPMGLQIKAVLEQAQTLHHTSFSFR